jgi:hypothetical protein
MKLSEISRYWAAKELTKITVEKSSVKLKAPFAAPDFTVKLNKPLKTVSIKNSAPLLQVKTIGELKSGTFYTTKSETLVCFDLKKGETEILI